MSIPRWDAQRRPPRLRALSPAGRLRLRPAALSLALFAALCASGCDPDLGVDPAWGGFPLPDPGQPVDDAMADVGAELFRRNCVACHSVGGGSVVGPDLKGVTVRRSQAWIRGMIARPDSMLRVDPVAQELLAQYQVPMLNRELDPARVRAVMEFLWRADHAPEPPAT